MERQFWSKTTIFGLAGLFAYAVTILVLFIPFKGEPSMSLIQWHSPLGTIVIILFIVSVILYIYGIFRKELHFSEKKAILEKRQKYLPELKEIVYKRLKKAEGLRGKAINLPLSQYFDKYLKYTNPYIKTRAKPTKSIEIITALAKHKFLWNNLYYRSLKDNDYNYKQSVIDYDLIYSQIDDNKLKIILNTLWVREHQSGSTQIFALISMNNPKIPNTPIGLRGGLYGKKQCEEALTICLNKFEKRMEILKSGGDL